MKTYQERKEEARQQAILWQLLSGDASMSYLEAYNASAHFAKLAKKYGLIKEFKENGII